MRATGSSIPRVDAVEKVTGTAVYAGDMTMPGQAWLKTVFAGVPHARVTALDVHDDRDPLVYFRGAYALLG